MKVALTGGGTGGHIYPALSVAGMLQADSEVESVLYIGKKDGLEASLVEKQGIPFEGISFFGMPRKNPLRWLQWFVQLNQAVDQSKAILKQFQPDVVMGTGGYVSAPVLMAAKQLKIPIMLHEPDAHPGLANKYLSQKATVITAAFEAAETQLKKGPKTRFVTTGNPIRLSPLLPNKEILFQQANLEVWDQGKPVLLVFGGSQGSRTINLAVAGAAEKLVTELDLQIFHVTGQKLYEETLDRLSDAAKSCPAYHLTPFCHQMNEWMQVSDIALCRSGSVSLSELFVAGLPSILIPFPFAAADHQRKNARFAVEKGAAFMVEDSELSADTLFQHIQKIVQSPDRLAAMKTSALSLAKPNATANIVALIKQVAQN